MMLEEYSGCVEDRRCFIQDGQSSATARALKRDAGLIIAPDIDVDVVEAAQRKTTKAGAPGSF